MEFYGPGPSGVQGFLDHISRSLQAALIPVIARFTGALGLADFGGKRFDRQGFVIIQLLPGTAQLVPGAQAVETGGTAQYI